MPVRPTRKTGKVFLHLKLLAIQVNLVVHRYGLQGSTGEYVEIYNRWGVLVYETKGYGQNQKYFRGVSEGRVTINQASELPVGTYFYIVKYVNNQGKHKERSGYLYINR